MTGTRMERKKKDAELDLLIECWVTQVDEINVIIKDVAKRKMCFSTRIAILKMTSLAIRKPGHRKENCKLQTAKLTMRLRM